ncbi:MAG TPA: hypothetical protein VJN18_35385 [Polyangiaceae bacterium]|nr:hypothetical protein [Polyangiaceae bacterium]
MSDTVSGGAARLLVEGCGDVAVLAVDLDPLSLLCRLVALVPSRAAARRLFASRDGAGTNAVCT